MRVCEEVTGSGLSVSSSNRLLKASHAYYNGQGEPLTVKRMMTLVKKSSCHNCKGVSCVMCEECKSWLISARVACVLCLDGSPPRVSQLFKSCDAAHCTAFQAVNDSYSFEEKKDVLNMVCKHKKTAPKNCLQYFSPTEHIGNLMKMDQFALLVNTSRDEIEATMQYCLKNGIYSYLFSLNCISCFRSLSETHLAELAESFWKEVKPPNRIRDFLDYPVNSINVARDYGLVPCPCIPSFLSLIVVDESKRRELRAIDTSGFMACVKDNNNADAFCEVVVDEEEEEEEDMQQQETDERRYNLRQHKQSQKMKEGQKQIQKLQAEERKERKKKKHEENEFCSLFRQCGCDDFSFLLNTILSKKEKQCKTVLYAHFGIKEETPSNACELLLTYSH